MHRRTRSVRREDSAKPNPKGAQASARSPFVSLRSSNKPRRLWLSHAMTRSTRSLPVPCSLFPVPYFNLTNMPNPSGFGASSDTNPAPAGHEPTRNVPAYCAPPFRPQRPICPQCPLVLARATMSRFSRLSEVIRNKPFSCFFVSGEAPHSCPEASATSRRLKRRGEARRRSFDLIVRLKG